MDQLVQQSGAEFAVCASDASDEIEQRNLSEAQKSLIKAGAGALRHTKEVEKLLERYKAVEVIYKKEEDKLTAKINEAHYQEKQAQSKKLGAEMSLQLQKDELRRYENELDRARDEYNEANRRRKDNNAGTVTTGIIAGAAGLLTIVTLGAAAPITVPIAAGATAGAIAFDRAADKAKDDMHRSEGNISYVKSKISSTDSTIHSLSNEIYSLNREIECYKEKRSVLHNEKGRVIKVIMFLVDAQVYGKKYADITEQCGRRTKLLERLIDTAEKKSYSLFDSEGTERILSSFEEAWVAFQEMNDKGANYVFKVEFECSECSCNRDEFPQVNNGQLICGHCFNNN